MDGVLQPVTSEVTLPNLKVQQPPTPCNYINTS